MAIQLDTTGPSPADSPFSVAPTRRYKKCCFVPALLHIFISAAPARPRSPPIKKQFCERTLTHIFSPQHKPFSPVIHTFAYKLKLHTSIMRSTSFALLATTLVSLMLKSVLSAATEGCQPDRPGSGSKTGKVKAYYPSYNSNGQSVSRIDFSFYTDVLFFAMIPQPGNKIFFDPKLTEEEGEELITKFVREAKENEVNPIISFGGWAGSAHFSTLTRTEAARKSFAEALVGFAQQRSFAGIELDWEYPNAAGIGCNSRDPQDVINFGLLVKELRKLWPQAQLTAAIGITGFVGTKGTPATSAETTELVANLDYVNLMAYDVYGAWAPTTGPIAPLYNTCAPPGFDQSVETGVKVATTQGFKPSQIILGIPGYAKRLELVSPKLNGTSPNGKKSMYYQVHTKETPPGGKFDDKAGEKDQCGAPTVAGGSFLVNELIKKRWLSRDQKTGLNGYTRYFDECSGQPFLTNGKYLISYDDEESTVAKAQYAKKQGLGGIYFFDTQGPADDTVRAAGKIIRG